MALNKCVVCDEKFEGRSHAKTCSYKCRRNLYRQNLRKEIDDYKVSKGCFKCGYDKHPAALDFNHIDPETKEFNIAHAGAIGIGRKRIYEEMEKCEILCACCHRIHTYETNTTRMGSI